jgi:putative molybdopterin biosynthesis protein
MIGEEIRRRREAAGLSLSELARQAGLSRQTLLAVERGAVPRADTAVRLARALDTTVESLVGTKRRTVWAGVPSGYARWAQVGGQLVLYPCRDWHADVEVTASGPRPLPGARDPERVAVLGGCDPTLPEWAERFAAAFPGWHCLVLNLPSQQALRLWQEGLLHVAGIHLSHPDGYNWPYVRALGRPAAIIRAVTWEAGLAFRPEDDGAEWPEWWEAGLLGARQEGSEARRLLDREVARRGLGPPTKPPPVLESHLAAAAAVADGRVRAAVMTKSAAALYGLAFQEWTEEPFDWLVPTPPDPAVDRLTALMERRDIRRWVDGIPGYNPTEMGRTVWEAPNH